MSRKLALRWPIPHLRSSLNETVILTVKDLPLAELFHFLHVIHQLLVLPEVHLVVFRGYLPLRFEEPLGELEVLLLDLLNFTLPNNQIQGLRAERHQGH